MFGFLLAALSFICPGDANGDNVVNILDLSMVVGHYGQTVEPWTNGDVDGDGFVTILDLVSVGQNYGRVCIPVPGLAVE